MGPRAQRRALSSSALARLAVGWASSPALQDSMRAGLSCELPARASTGTNPADD
eukprot:CAMPEP_0171166496 /NCGR_PEP_ID=MMETSP0790-20130122/6724_1 /TAXON_ID=2925 /ORGANISM="Alexandrium catenella, Strain OF101" /LENGTH=53 /DNA_ID=CAMNT_0011631305 /DNA_START=34 /DNA_END=195 /DNA_ORIENTATION=-